MPPTELRGVTEGDWPEILRLADLSAPNAREDNRVWLSNRRAFAGTRHHYLAVNAGESSAPVAYGAIEQATPDSFRMFIVADEPSLGDVGVELLARLESDAIASGARILWAREAAGDPLIAFFERQGFNRTRTYDVDGRTVINLELALS